MKKLNAFLVSVFSVAALNAAVIEQVIVRQQWPWSTDVKVEYKLSGVTKPVDLAVQAFNGATELALPAEAITGDRYGITEDGVGTLVIDPVKAFGTAKVALANFKVKLTVSDSPASRTEVLYKIIDIDANPVAITDVTRADILNGKYGTYETDYSVFSSFGRNVPSGYPDVTYSTTLSDVLIWTGVTNGNLYRTSRIALRKIPAAGKSFAMGKWEAAGTDPSAKIPVSFTKDFWIGVFPVTQYQLHKFRPDLACFMKDTTNPDHVLRAADGMRWDLIRGTYKASWPHGTHADVANNSFFSLLQAATGNARLDLPTDAQWEFAARGGSDAMYPHGYDMTSISSDYYWLYYGGLFKTTSNSSESVASSTDIMVGAYPPGLFAPNAYGLYDVMGNVWQWCLDRAVKNYQTARTGGEDPRGSDSDEPYNANGTYRIRRGGSWAAHNWDVGQANADCEYWGSAGNGFRICLHEED